MNAIADRPHYIEAMRKTLDEKLFFMDKLKPDFILDFGCADGALVEAAVAMQPGLIAWGYDMDPEMFQGAMEFGNHGFYTSDLTHALHNAMDAPGTRVLVLSSVLHEIYSACATDEIRALWKSIQEVGFDYIVIRDMLYDASCELVEDQEYNDLFQYREELAQSFESMWGSLKIRENFVHFLLKYRYVVNWNREVEENYLSINRYELLETFKLMGYEFEYWEQHSLDFIKESIYKDFYIWLDDKTHVKAIFKKK